ILTIACVNYINLATTKAIDRARDVGIRKVSGARSLQLILQFLFESVILNVIALLFAAVLVVAAKYFLPRYIGSASMGLLFDQSLYLHIALVIILGVLLSGIYPAAVLARVKPIIVLKGRYSFSRSGILLRKSMVA